MSLRLNPNKVECKLELPSRGQDGAVQILSKGKVLYSKTYSCENPIGVCTIPDKRIDAAFNYEKCLEQVGRARYSNNTDVPLEFDPSEVQCHAPVAKCELAFFNATVDGYVISAAAQSYTSSEHNFEADDYYIKCMTAVGVSQILGGKVHVQPGTGQLFSDIEYRGDRATIVASTEEVSCKREVLPSGDTHPERIISEIRVGPNVVAADKGSNLYAHCLAEKGLATLLTGYVDIPLPFSGSWGNIDVKDAYSLSANPLDISCSYEDIGDVENGGRVLMFRVDDQVVYAEKIEARDTQALLQQCEETLEDAIRTGERVYINYGNSASIDMNTLLTTNAPNDKTILVRLN